MVDRTSHAVFQADHDVASASSDLSPGMATWLTTAADRTNAATRLTTTMVSHAAAARSELSRARMKRDVATRTGPSRSRVAGRAYQCRDIDGRQRRPRAARERGAGEREVSS